MGQMKTPGVYVVEKNAFPNSVVEVATAVPAFIGYTQKADNKGKSLLNKPWRISFHQYYGYAPEAKFTIEEKAADSTEVRLSGWRARSTSPLSSTAGTAAGISSTSGCSSSSRTAADPATSFPLATTRPISMPRS